MTAIAISPDQIDTPSFDVYLSRKQRISAVVLGASGASLVASGAFATGTAGADAGAAAKASIQSGVTNAIGMISAIDGIGLAAFGVALAPMGFMLTLRVLNMVLSRV